MDPFGLTPVPSVTCLVNESAGTQTSCPAATAVSCWATMKKNCRMTRPTSTSPGRTSSPTATRATNRQPAVPCQPCRDRAGHLQRRGRPHDLQENTRNRDERHLPRDRARLVYQGPGKRGRCDRASPQPLRGPQQRARQYFHYLGRPRDQWRRVRQHCDHAGRGIFTACTVVTGHAPGYRHEPGRFRRRAPVPHPAWRPQRDHGCELIPRRPPCIVQFIRTPVTTANATQRR